MAGSLLPMAAQSTKDESPLLAFWKSNFGHFGTSAVTAMISSRWNN